MQLPRLFIAAAHKSSGKTTVSLGLAAALRARGRRVQSFKKGPDYIDPLWHRLASGRPCYNLDFNTQEHDEILALFIRKAQQADISLIEANKGLFDGIDLKGADSNAALAALLKAPVVLVIDTVGMTRGIAPLLIGYETFARRMSEPVRIAGVILNRVGGPRHEDKLRAAVEHYTDMPVLGAVPRDPSMVVQERHLGLTTPGDMARLEEHLAAIGERIAGHVALSQIEDIATEAVPLALGAQAETVSDPEGGAVSSPASAERVRIAIAQDEAFCFYYQDDLEAFAQEGAELVPFSPVHDKRLPEDVDGLFLGGGFPETHMHALAANRSMRESIRCAIDAGLPAYAECGGLMYLAREIVWKEARAEMCGVLPGRVVMHERPQGRGLIRLRATGDAPWSPILPGETLRAHEFHHAAYEGARDTAGARHAWAVLRGHGTDGRHDGLIVNNLIAGFAHLRHTRQSPWVSAFVRFIRSRI